MHRLIPTPPPPDWSLPRGVTRSLWEYAHEPQIARRDAEHLAGSSLVELDERLVHEWCSTPGPVIDLGCGPGRQTLSLARRGFPVLAVDLSPEALSCVRRAAQSEGLNVGVLRANLCELDSVPDQSFRTALLMFGTLGMIAGADNRRLVLEHARRVLCDSGQLILHAHNVWRHLFDPTSRWWLLQDRLRGIWRDPSAGDSRRDYRGIPGMYHHAFSWRELRRLLNAAGFRILESVPVGVEGVTPRDIGWPRNIRCTGWIVLAETA